jgi:hypothetical protein
LRISFRSDSGTFRLGRNVFAIEFSSRTTGALIDAGDVQLAGAMTMPGMVMSGGIEVRRTGTAGRYEATADFEMSGAWRFTIEWNGPGNSGLLTFVGDVQ